MLADSSVWIDYLRGGKSPETRLLLTAMQQRGPIWLAPPILQEVLQGADSAERFARWRKTLGTLPLIQDRDQRGLTVAAAELYATCRWQGFTPRSANDCLIACYALRAGLPLLHRDRDFVRLAEIEPKLQLIHPGP